MKKVTFSEKVVIFEIDEKYHFKFTNQFEIDLNGLELQWFGIVNFENQLMM